MGTMDLERRQGLPKRHEKFYCGYLGLTIDQLSQGYANYLQVIRNNAVECYLSRRDPYTSVEFALVTDCMKDIVDVFPRNNQQPYDYEDIKAVIEDYGIAYPDELQRAELILERFHHAWDRDWVVTINRLQPPQALAWWARNQGLLAPPFTLPVPDFRRTFYPEVVSNP